MIVKTAFVALSLLASTPAAAATCTFVVGRETLVDGPCDFYPRPAPRGEAPNRSFSFLADGYMVYVLGRMSGGDRAQAYWNGHERNDRAHAYLGVVYSWGECWINAVTRICVKE